MVPPKQKSQIYVHFKILKRWDKIEDLKEADKYLSNLIKIPSFAYFYEKNRSFYSQLPSRNDGANAFLHPLNTTINLLRAGVTDEATLCSAISHDYVEEMVDFYKKKNKIDSKSKENRKLLDDYEKKVFRELEEDLSKYCQEKKIDCSIGREVLDILKMLTRHKKDWYYQSISQIFKNEDKKIKEKALCIKLADRIHNILCLGSYTNQERIYQSFKNIFLLNNTKKYLLEEYGPNIFFSKKMFQLERLYNKCCKSTYDALSRVCHYLITDKNFYLVCMLRLSFKKFSLERQEMERVTRPNARETHLFRLFQGVIRKYDARLHQDWDTFNQMKDDEFGFCRHFFRDFNLNEKELQSIIDYKDAYAMRGAVSYLLYRPTFVVVDFDYSKMFRRR